MDASPLRKLPPEIRIIIYELVLFQPDGILIDCSPWVPHLRSRAFDEEEHRLALPQTCRDIRQESFPVFLALNNFCFYAWRMDESDEQQRISVRCVGRWLEQIGPAPNHLRSLQFDEGKIHVDRALPAPGLAILAQWTPSIIRKLEKLFNNRQTELTIALRPIEHMSFPAHEIKLPLFDLERAHRMNEQRTTKYIQHINEMRAAGHTPRLDMKPFHEACFSAAKALITDLETT